MKLIIGVIGENGSGKETFSKLLQDLLPDKKIVSLRTSEVLRKTLELWNLPIIRENYSLLVIKMEEVFGPGALAGANKKLIDEINADIVVVDGLRRHPELDLIRSFPENLLVYITAPAKLRFERLRNRGEKEQETQMTFEQFQEQENLPTEKLIKELSKQADFRIENDGSLENFRKKLVSLPLTLFR